MTFHRIVDGKPVALTDEEAAPYATGAKRHRMWRGFKVALTGAEEAARDAEELAWAADAPKRELVRIEQASGMERWQRDLVIAQLPADHPQRKKAEAAEAAIAALGVRK